MPRKKIDTSQKIESSKKEVKYKNVKTKDSNSKDINVSEPKVADKNAQSPTGYPEVRELFARKKDYGVVTMTEQASTRADETSKERRSQNLGNLPPRLGNCVRKIRED